MGPETKVNCPFASFSKTAYSVSSCCRPKEAEARVGDTDLIKRSK